MLGGWDVPPSHRPRGPVTTGVNRGSANIPTAQPPNIPTGWEGVKLTERSFCVSLKGVPKVIDISRRISDLSTLCYIGKLFTRSCDNHRNETN